MLFFSVMDEGSSLLFARNLAHFLPAEAGGNVMITTPSQNDAVSVRLLGSYNAAQGFES